MLRTDTHARCILIIGVDSPGTSQQELQHLRSSWLPEQLLHMHMHVQSFTLTKMGPSQCWRAQATNSQVREASIWAWLSWSTLSLMTDFLVASSGVPKPSRLGRDMPLGIWNLRKRSPASQGLAKASHKHWQTKHHQHAWHP